MAGTETPAEAPVAAATGSQHAPDSAVQCPKLQVCAALCHVCSLHNMHAAWLLL
jgi:hypothetical protein